MDTDRFRRVEVLSRVLLVAVTLVVLPQIFIGDVTWYWNHGLGVGLHHLPYRDFVWEFPPLTVPVVALVGVTGHHYGLFLVAFVCVMVTCELAALRILRRDLPSEQRAPLTAYWMAVGLPLATIAWFRFDWLPVLCAVIAFTRLVRGRPAAAALVAGVAAKLWPVVLAVLLIADRRWKQLAWTVLGTVGLMAGWFAFAPAGFRAFWEYRRGSGLQLESVGGALLLLVKGGHPAFVSGAWVVGNGGYRWVDPAAMLAFAVLGLVVVHRLRRDPASVDPAALCGGLVVCVLLGSHLLSPQYMVWPLPFLALAWARGERRATVAFAAASFLTVFELARYHALLTAARWMAAVVCARNALLVAVAYWLLTAALRRPEQSVEAGGELSTVYASQP
jgi:hypothetical protein